VVTFFIVVVGSVGACVVICACIVVWISIAIGSWHENFIWPIIRHWKSNKNIFIMIEMWHSKNMMHCKSHYVGVTLFCCTGVAFVPIYTYRVDDSEKICHFLLWYSLNREKYDVLILNGQFGNCIVQNYVTFEHNWIKIMNETVFQCNFKCDFGNFWAGNLKKSMTMMLVTSLCWWSQRWRLFAWCWWCIKSVTNILNRSPISQTHLVTNIRRQHQYKRKSLFRWIADI